MGKPRYLPSEGVDANLRISHNDSLVSLSTFGEKKALDFVILTDCPDMLHKSSRASLVMEQFSPFAFPNNTKSSAKNRYEKTRPLWDALTGCQSFASHFSRIS